MKKTMMAELLQQDIRSLGSRVLEHKRELLNLRLQHRRNKLENPRQISKIRGEVARLKTALTMKKINKKED
jgi:ribosomal protein L29